MGFNSGFKGLNRG